MKNEKKIAKAILLIIVIGLFLITFAFDFIKIDFFSKTLKNRLILKVIQQGCGSVAVILVLKLLNIRLFNKVGVVGLLYMIPCLIIAVDNFQFSAYFNGYMNLIYKDWVHVLLFAAYCLLTGIFEEGIFRGILFAVVADLFPNNRKGLILTIIISSIVFGLAHIINGISIQVLYTMLTGAVFAYCLIKTKNILCCASIHGIYNFCGLLFGSKRDLGLGTGVVFDLGTIITMLIVSIVIGLFILWSIFRHSEDEQVLLYERLGVKNKSVPQEGNK